MNNRLDWKTIWNKRSHTNGIGLDLEALLKLDGYDTGAGCIQPDDWQKYVETISKKLGIFDDATVYEVGCGAGAFLYALRQQYRLTVGGLDYSVPLITAASIAIPDGLFTVADAHLLDTDSAFDFVIANGVFHYFSDEYAAEVVERMLKKARIAVGILEVPDSKTKIELEALRKAKLSQDEYEKKYSGLEHTYYKRDWFEKLAEKKPNLTCTTFDGCIPNYAQNNFRFCVIFKKI